MEASEYSMVEKGIVSNLEYSEEDGNGHVQYFVAGRYLMDVQLARLPLESFQGMEDPMGFLRRYCNRYDCRV